ncbi:hypothetical protein [Subtercola lobariae]|uniref:Ig-like domain-containing protein n=1 Tax=Subtercola lobariae TaxID=1588641 RepID=A0A917B5Z2_9MICO|nr:hypothetical protein [Subtercola lobariae]GGF26597.1 hypothetical protein GCM10011399_19950 [Subtercola lobariae]
MATQLGVSPAASISRAQLQSLTALSCERDQIADITPLLTYQWNRNGVLIIGATAATWVLTNSDAGTSITVIVTGTKSGYSPISTISAVTPVLANK